MAIVQLQERRRNLYTGNCSECSSLVLSGDGYLFKNTKYRNSKGYYIKCEDCCTGATAKRIREAEKSNKPKTLSLSFAKKWCQSLEFKVFTDDWHTYCEIYDNEVLLLGLCNAFEGFQEYPNYDWCDQEASRLNGLFTDNAVEYICEHLTEKIQEVLTEQEIINCIKKDFHVVTIAN